MSNWIVHFGPVEIFPRSCVEVGSRPQVRFTPQRWQRSTTIPPPVIEERTYEPEEWISFEVENDTDEVICWRGELRGTGVICAKG